MSTLKTAGSSVKTTWKFREVSIFNINKETEKAFGLAIMTYSPYADDFVEQTVWFPKSVCITTANEAGERVALEVPVWAICDKLGKGDEFSFEFYSSMEREAA